MGYQLGLQLSSEHRDISSRDYPVLLRSGKHGQTHSFRHPHGTELLLQQQVVQEEPAPRAHWR
jgi:hypothetical protein